MNISPLFTGILGLIAATVMILLGANLVGIFRQSKVTLPGGIFQMFRKLEHKTFTPIVIGIGTFFLPCGFTQSMQIAALSSGSYITGGLIMFSFALGTFPVLALLSFGAEGFSRSIYAPLFFKSAGVVVLGLGIFALLAGLA
jgi:sulfite exporter TauE/SafE